MIRRLLGGMLLSGLVHIGMFAAALGFIAWSASHSDPVNIDLSASSLLLRADRPKSASQIKYNSPIHQWFLAAKGRPQPIPTPAAPNITVTPEVEIAAPPCPPPCPENAGDWTPAENLSIKPVWQDGVITEGDYPIELRKKKKEGLVVADVLIDADGKVRGVDLVKGSEQGFNNLVVERLARSGFQPARDREGHAVPCRARIPIQFQIQ